MSMYINSRNSAPSVGYGFFINHSSGASDKRNEADFGGRQDDLPKGVFYSGHLDQATISKKELLDNAQARKLLDAAEGSIKSMPRVFNSVQSKHINNSHLTTIL